MKITEQEFNEAVERAAKSVTDDVVLPDKSLISSVVEEPVNADYVLAHNDELTKKYADLLSVYGYDDFEGLYLSCQADFASDGEKSISRDNEAEKATSKNKDVSKLKLVQRTVMRRGKPTTLSFYEDPNKGVKNTNTNSEKPDNQEGQEQDFTGFYTSGDTFGKPDRAKISQLMPPDDWFTSGSKSSHLYDCMYFVTGSMPDTVAGVKKVDNMLTLAFVSTPDKETYQLGLYRSLKKLVYLIYRENYNGKDLGFTYKPKANEEDICKVLFDYFDIHKSKGAYTQRDLSKSLGERQWKKWQ